MAIEYPTKEMIDKKLEYNHETGEFKSKLSGRNVGYLDGKGYVVIWIYNHEYRAHRLAMVLQKINLEGLEVDHANGVRNDNRLVNLSVVTKKINAKNKRLRRDNKTGVHGVSWAKELGKWRARISTDKNRYVSLGCYRSLLDAICARKSAELTNNYHKNHGRCAL